MLKVFYLYYHIYSSYFHEAGNNICILLEKLGSDRLKWLSKASQKLLKMDSWPGLSDNKTQVFPSQHSVSQD